MTKTQYSSIRTALIFAVFTLVFGSAQSVFAAEQTARLGGGNALARATAGQSQGLSNANPASTIFARLTFAGTHGGKPDEVPPENGQQSNSGGNTANGGTGTEGDVGAEDAVSSASSAGGNNGGASSGNGGNGGEGGSASPGGLVRAGNVVSNANAVNAINTTIIRISIR